VDHGATKLLLIGYSMGGGIVVSFLYQSALADRVVGVILDAPMLDFEATVDWGARDRFVLWPLKDAGKALAGMKDVVASSPRLKLGAFNYHPPQKCVVDSGGLAVRETEPANPLHRHSRRPAKGLGHRLFSGDLLACKDPRGRGHPACGDVLGEARQLAEVMT